MTSTRRNLSLLSLAAVAAACAPRAGRHSTADTARLDTAAVARARTAAGALGKELQSRLLAALDLGGASHAITYCADSAQALTARHARAGVYVRRVSLRVRNPANRPDAIEERQLRYLDSLHRAGALPVELVRLRSAANGRHVVEYARPIIVQPGCLACHGDRQQLAPGVRELLATRYPSDQATGYRVGDLRGMISVRVPQ